MEEKGKYQGMGGWKKGVLAPVDLELLHSMRTRYVYHLSLSLSLSLCHRYIYICNVVQFYPWFNFDFPLFFSMLIYDDEHKTKENIY